MFIQVPINRYNEDNDTDERVELDLNPLHVVTIEPHTTRRSACIVWLVNGGELEVELSKRKLNQTLTEFMKENILVKFYKDLKDRNS